jgi:hypothetical protein
MWMTLARPFLALSHLPCALSFVFYSCLIRTAWPTTAADVFTMLEWHLLTMLSSLDAAVAPDSKSSCYDFFSADLKWVADFVLNEIMAPRKGNGSGARIISSWFCFGLEFF